MQCKVHLLTTNCNKNVKLRWFKVAKIKLIMVAWNKGQWYNLSSWSSLVKGKLHLTADVLSVSSNVQSASAHMTGRKKSIGMLKVFSWLLSSSLDAVSGFGNNLVSFIDFLCLWVTLIPALITYTDYYTLSFWPIAPELGLSNKCTTVKLPKR